MMKPLPIHVILSMAACLIASVNVRAEDPTRLTILFQKQKDPAQIKAHADQVAQYLSQQMGVEVQAFVPGAYSASVQALVSAKADLAYVSSVPFLLAQRDAGAELLLAEQRPDPQGAQRTDYDSIFVVAKDSNLTSMQDLVANAQDLRIAFTSTTSTSGYVMAYARLVNEGLLSAGQDAKDVFKSVVFAGSYSQALQQVLDGKADVCAVSDYTLEGPRADAYLDQTQRSRLRVLARTPGVPTHVICSRPGLSDGFKDRLVESLLKLGQEQPDLLANVYGANAFVKVDPTSHLAAAVQAVQYLGIPIESFVKGYRTDPAAGPAGK